MPSQRTAGGKLVTLGAKDLVSEGDPRQASNISILPVNPVPAYNVKGYVNNLSIQIVLDTGAAVTLLKKDIWDKLHFTSADLEQWTRQPLVGVEGTPLNVHGTMELELKMGEEIFQTKVIVADGLTAELILGLDFLEEHNCTIEIGRKTLHFIDRGTSVTLQGCGEVTMPIGVAMGETVQVPAYSEMKVMVNLTQTPTSGTWIMEGDTTPIIVARSLHNNSTGEIPVRLLNPTAESVTLYKRQKIGMLQEAEEELEPCLGVSTIQTGNLAENIKAKREMLWKLVEGGDGPLTEANKEQLFYLLGEYADIFAISKEDLGRTAKVQHRINTGNSHPIRQPLRRIPPAKWEEVRQLLKEMLDQDVIKPTNSPWASPVVIVKKKDGSPRFCVDYRKVNTVTRKDAYPLPRIDDTLDTLAGSKWFSTLDLLSGYWQVEVRPEDREKTAFCTPDGLFEFNVMPFGLCNAPATFQRLMDTVLAGLQWTNCLVYLDDVIVLGRTFKEHLSNLKEVFDKFREARLKLKASKCALCQEKVEFLGHIVSANGVATDPKKTEKVANWPVPRSRREVQQFLGLANYYRRFVQDYARIAKPLHRLTEKNTTFKWTSECEGSFENLRQNLVSAPVLAFPDCSRPFILDTDARDSGIGAVLSQVQDDGTERVIAYASRTLSKAERRYCVTRRELLAAVVFIRQFRSYLLGNKFTLRTDHGSLRWLWNFKQPEGQLARWLEKLQEYDFIIEHRQGRKHNNADALSRLPCNQCGRESHFTETDQNTHTVGLVTNEENANVRGKSPEEIPQLQLADPMIGPVLKSLESLEKPTLDHIRSQPPKSRRLFQLWEQLIILDGQLWRLYENEEGSSVQQQLVVPSSLKREIMEELHEGVMSGHLGQEKTMQRLKRRFYWPGQWNDVRDWCNTCPICATRKTTQPKSKAPLQPIKPSYPMQIIAMDILGPLPESEAGNSYILVIGDYLTRWMEAYPIPNQEATTVARILTNELFYRFSLPEQLHTDQGRQFESELISEICRLLKIRKTRTTPYHPQCDGLVERFNRTLLNMLATCLKDHHFLWEDYIRPVCMAYNTSTQSTTGYTPFYLMFGRQAKLPVDIMYGTNAMNEVSPNQHAADLRTRLTEAYEKVRQHLNIGQEWQKEFYDRRVHGKPYDVGALVWLHSLVLPRGKSKKFHHPWTGPFIVVKRLSDVTYRIQSREGRRRLVVHFDRLKLCHPGTRFNSEYLPPSQPDNSRLQQNHEVPFGTQLQLIDDDDLVTPPPSRYPHRDRRPPDRLASYIHH